MTRRNSMENFYHFPGGKSCCRLMILGLLMLVVAAARTGIPREAEIDMLLKKLNKPSVKTIQSEDGDTVDCVDIYKQLAFDNPLLKNHTIMMRPSYLPKVKKDNFSLEAAAQQIWQRSGSCPSGTIPIRRIRKSELLRARSFGLGGLNTSTEPRNCKRESAGVTETPESPSHGVSAHISIWDLQVESGECSLNSVAAVKGESMVEAGWWVCPVLISGPKARIFVNWRDGEDGCFNNWCPGFVQVSNNFMLGAVLSPVSTYGGKQYVVDVRIYKDDDKQLWWLSFSDEVVGYWPMSVVRNLPSAERVEWLGKVCDKRSSGYHTTTQMGNGHFPSEGHGKSSFFKHLGIKKDREGTSRIRPICTLSHFLVVMTLRREEMKCIHIMGDQVASAAIGTATDIYVSANFHKLFATKYIKYVAP